MRPVCLLATAAAVVSSMPHTMSAQELTVDTTGAGALIDQALNHSQVMENLQYLSDVIGPRLTGSPAVRRANDWTLARFRSYGLGGHLEAWTFGGTGRAGRSAYG